MKVQKQYRWLAVDDFQQSNPLSGRILEINDAGKDGLLCVMAANGATLQFTLFRDAINALIDKYGDDTDKWIGARLQILRTEQIGGKVRKTVTLI